MDYIREAVEQLSNYNLLVASLTIMQGQLEALRLEKYNIKAQIISSEPRGGGGEPDDKIVNNIFKRKILINNIVATNKKINCIDKSLAALDKNEKRILDRVFIIGGKNGIRDIAEELTFSNAQVYRMRDKAIRRFSIALFGICAS